MRYYIVQILYWLFFRSIICSVTDGNALEYVIQRKSVYSEWDAESEHLAAYVQSSETLVEQLEDEFEADESFLFEGNTVIAVGKSVSITSGHA